MASAEADLAAAVGAVAVFDVDVHGDLARREMKERADWEERVCLIVVGHTRLAV